MHLLVEFSLLMQIVNTTHFDMIKVEQFHLDTLSEIDHHIKNLKISASYVYGPGNYIVAIKFLGVVK